MPMNVTVDCITGKIRQSDISKVEIAGLTSRMTAAEIAGSTAAERIGILEQTATESIAGLTTSVAGLTATVDGLLTVTAFEVFAHDTAILAGSTILGAEVWGDPSLTVKVDIPACRVERFSLWLTKPRTDCDITIEWGDGTTESVAELTPVSYADDLVLVGHTYTADGKYTVRVLGRDYIRLAHNSSGNSTGENRLVCRIMASDLPVADHITNFASLCSGCKHLLKVAVPGYAPYMSRVSNWSSCFSACSNLQSVTGFGYNFNPDANTGSLFIDCKNMTTTDFVIPAQSDSIVKIFQNCPELTMDIAALLPANGFSASRITVNSVFYNCVKLTGTVPDGSLWNGASEWEIIANTSSSGRLLLPFTNCASALRAQVPESWGGTASDSIIHPRLTGLDILHPITVTGGTVVLDAAHNAYMIAPTAATAITIDATGLGEVTGSAFTLIVDMSAEVQTVTFPSNFSFVGGTAPTMSAKGYYVIRATYSALGKGGFFGEYIGVTKDPADTSHGIWYWNPQGELDTSVYEGDEYANSVSLEGGTLLVNAGSALGGNTDVKGWDADYFGVVSTLVLGGGTAANVWLDMEMDTTGSAANLVVDGGTVTGTVDLIYGSAEGHCVVNSGIVNTVYGVSGGSLTVNGGTVGTVYACFDFFVNVTINGGLVNELHPAGSVTITGGVVNSITPDTNFGIVTMTGGSVGLLICTSGGNLFLNPVSITGGVIDNIDDTGDYGGAGAYSIGGTAVVKQIAPSNLDGGNFTSIIVSGGTVARLDYHDEMSASSECGKLWVSGGTVGITPATRALLTAGIIGGTFEATATIVDLDY